ETLDLGGELRGKGPGVEDRCLRDAALALEDALPGRVDLVAQRCDPAHAGDDDASIHALCLRMTMAAVCPPDRAVATLRKYSARISMGSRRTTFRPQSGSTSSV